MDPGFSEGGGGGGGGANGAGPWQEGGCGSVCVCSPPAQSAEAFAITFAANNNINVRNSHESVSWHFGYHLFIAAGNLLAHVFGEL